MTDAEDRLDEKRRGLALFGEICGDRSPFFRELFEHQAVLLTSIALEAKAGSLERVCSLAAQLGELNARWKRRLIRQGEDPPGWDKLVRRAVHGPCEATVALVSRAGKRAAMEDFVREWNFCTDVYTGILRSPLSHNDVRQSAHAYAKSLFHFVAAASRKTDSSLLCEYALGCAARGRHLGRQLDEFL